LSRVASAPETTLPGALSADGFVAPSERVCDPADVESVLNGVAWLLYVTPAGDPARAPIAALVEELLACVNGAEFVVDIGSVYTWDAKDKARGEALFKAMDAAEQVFTEGEGDEQKSVRGKDTGNMVLVQSAHYIQGYLRPARCADVDGPVLKAALGLDPEVGRPAVARWRAVRSPAFQAAVARGLDAAVPAGSWDQDPRRSAPEVVRAVMDAHGLTEDSAVIGLVRLTAMRGESCTEIFAIDRGPWVDLPALLGLLNSLLHNANSSRRYAVLRGHTSAARVLCEDELAIRASVQAGLLELEDPDDALTRSYEDEPS
jgi:hypothetical protein